MAIFRKASPQVQSLHLLRAHVQAPAQSIEDGFDPFQERFGLRDIPAILEVFKDTFADDARPLLKQSFHLLVVHRIEKP